MEACRWLGKKYRIDPGSDSASITSHGGQFCVGKLDKQYVLNKMKKDKKCFPVSVSLCSTWLCKSAQLANRNTDALCWEMEVII